VIATEDFSRRVRVGGEKFALAMPVARVVRRNFFDEVQIFFGSYFGTRAAKFSSARQAETLYQ
jgi:hypothetical protein